MLLVEDTHIVVGREELPLEDAYRTTLAPGVAADPSTRLAGFFWAPHGAGEGYEAVSLVLLDDIDALARHQERLATGDLADCWLSLEAKQRTIESRACVVAAWSPIAQRPVSSYELGPEHPTAVFRLDTFTLGVPVADCLAEIEAQHQAASDDDALAVVACWSPLLGDLDEPSVRVLTRVRSTDALRAVFAAPDGTRPWSGQPTPSGVRRHQTQLLRSVSWSPIGQGLP
jgi:hypothetical protein